MRNRTGTAQRQLIARDNQRAWWFAFKAALACERCGFNENAACLHFHHRDPATKLFALADVGSRLMSRERILAEVAKCKVLCANCHTIEHAPQRNITFPPPGPSTATFAAD